jgi:Ca-activated chloride channel family protein
LAAGNAARAAELFRDPAWKGSAQFQAGNWAGAVESFAQAKGKDADYNRGNALARAGKLEDALAAYDAALAADPGMEDARANRKLVEDLLRQQKSEGEKNASDARSDAADQRDGAKSPDNPGAQQQNPGDSGSSGSSPDASGSPPSRDGSGDPGKESNKSDAGSQGSAPDGRTDERPAPKADASAKNRDNASTGTADGSGTDGKENTDNPDKGAPIAGETDAKAREEDQAVEQWLRQVPDDPGALLRRKFEYEAARRAGGNGR